MNPHLQHLFPLNYQRLIHAATSQGWNLSLREGCPSEKLLHIIWNEKIAGENFNSQGHNIAILHPGYWNCDNDGPDFADACISIDNKIKRGAIEIHRRPEDWLSHKHHQDPNYKEVILHVVWHNPADKQIPHNIPYICLENSLPLSISEIEKEWNSWDYSEQQKYPTEEEAHILEELTDNQLIHLFTSAGIFRALNKAEKIKTKTIKIGLEQTFYEGLLEALGYSQNRVAFKALSKSLPLKQLQSYKTDIEKEAAFWGHSQLLPDLSQTKVCPKLLKLNKELWNTWWRIRDEHSPISWCRKNTRPTNSPERRVAAAIEILKKEQWQLRPFLIRCLEKIDSPKELHLEITQFFELQSLWNNYYTFQKPCNKEIGLIGKSRQLDIIVNIIIPTLLSLKEVDNDTRNKIIDYYIQLPPLQSNSTLHRGQFRYFIPPERMKRCIKKSCQQQGFIQFSNDFFKKLNKDKRLKFWQLLCEEIKREND